MKNGLARTNWLLAIVGLILGVFLSLWGSPARPALATTPNNQTINFQGRLLNAQGATVPDGNYNIEFKIYQDGDGKSAGDTTGSPAGSLKWTEDYLNANSQGVRVVNGFLSVQLGSINPFGSNIDWNAGNLWLSMNIGGMNPTCSPFSSCSPDGEMLPMQPLTAAPYSLNSGELGGLTSSQYLQLAQGVQTDASSVSSIGVNKTGTSGDILQLQKSGVDVAVVDNSGTALFRPATDSATALQVENRANGYDVLTVDTSGNQVILGKAGSLTGKLTYATAGGGTLTLNPTSSASNFIITFPAETGTVCTTATTGVCNTAGGLSNVAYLNQSQTFTNKNTFDGPSAGSSSAVNINTNAASNAGLILQGASSQTADLVEVQDSTGANLLEMSSSGSIDQMGNFNTPFGGLGSYGNLLTQSEAFNNSGGLPWTYSNVTVPSANTVVAPDGNTTAESLSDSGVGGSVSQSVSGGNHTYTFSVWIESTSGNQNFSLRIDSNGTPATGTVFNGIATPTWQRFSVTQTFTSGVTTVTPTIFPGGTGSAGVVAAWGAQLVQSSSRGVYVQTFGSAVNSGDGLVDNGSAIFQNAANSGTAYQFQNASGVNVATVDTSAGQLVLGTSGSSGVTGQIKLNYAGQTGSITLQTANPSSSPYTITIPAETGTICTTAGSSACTAVYAPAGGGGGYVILGPNSVQADSSNNNSIFINKTSGTGNILELQKSAGDVFKIDNSGNVTSTGQNTLSRNSSGSNDYTLGVNGTPSATGSSSLVRIGSALTGGNGAANGGTYLSIVEPTSGAGSAADFLNFQSGATPTVQLQLASNGNLTVGGTYNGNTFDNAGHLTFGNSGAATITSNSSGANNLTVDTGNSGATLVLGNTAGTTTIGNSNAAHTINIGTGGAGTTTQAITIGAATNSTSTLLLQGGNGSGAISLQTGNNGSSAGSIQIGNTSGAFSQSIAIGNNNSATNAVNIGTGTAQDNVTIGDTTNTASSVTLKGGSTGGITLGANTSLSSNSNLSYVSGTGKFDASNATGTFDTSTGLNHLNGNTTVTGTNTFAVNAGATTLNGSAAGSGTAVSITTGAASNVGLNVQAAASQSAALLQLQDSTGASLLTYSAGAELEQSGNVNTPFGGLGSYGNLLSQSEAFNNGAGAPWTYSGVTVPSPNTVVSPDGNTTAESLADTSSGGSVSQSISGGNNTYTFSVWLKSTSGNQNFALRIDSNGTPATGTAYAAIATPTWQRFSVTQTFTSGVTTVKPTIFPGGTAGSGTVAAWGAQLVQGSTKGVYVQTFGAAVSSGEGLVNNGNSIFQNAVNSATAYQFQNASGVNVATVDTSAGQLVLGTSGASGVTGQIKLNYSGQTGSITLQTANPSSTPYTITIPAETGTICTTAASAACTAVYAPAGGGYVNFAPSSVQADSSNNNTIFINKTSGTGNILELQKSAGDVFKIDNTGNVSSTGQNTLSRNSTGSNDYTVGITGTPSATGSSSLVRIGNALSGGNGVTNGGTYLSIVEPAAAGATAGSAADFLNLQNGSTVELQLASNGNLTVGGTYNGNTFDNAGHLTFGNSGAATIASNGSNNLTVDTGSSGGTLALGNNAANTNIGTSNAAHTIGIGTGGAGTTTQAITIGAATNSSSTLLLQGGNGSSAISLQTGNNGTTAGTIQIGNTSGAFNQSIAIASNNTSGATNTVSIGTGSTAVESISIGSATAGSSFTVESGTGTVNLFNGATNHTIQLATGAAVESVTIGSTNTTSSTSIQGGTSGAVNIGSTGSSTLASSTHVGDTNNATGAQNVTVGSAAANTSNSVTLQADTIKQVLTNAGVDIQSTVNNATTFQVQNAVGTQVINVNTTSTNMVTDPSFEQALTGWSPKGTGGSIAETSSVQYIGNNSLAVTTGGTTLAGAQSSVSLLANTTYTLSMYAEAYSNSIATISIGAQYSSGGSANDNDCLTAQTITASNWTKLSCTFTTSSSVSSPNIYIKDTGTNHIFYIDAIQVTPFSLLTNPSIEQALAGNWTVYNGAGGTATQTSAQHYDGNDSLSLNNGGQANRGVQQSITLNAGSEYYLSFEAMSTVNFSALRVGYSNTGATGGEVDCLTGLSVVTTGWTQYSCTFTTPSTTSGTPYIYFVDTTNTNLTFYIDAVELSLGPSVASYASGAPVTGSYVTNPTTSYQEGALSLNGIIASPVTLQAQSNSTTAFQVQSANGAALFVADTTNRQIRIYENNGNSNYALIYYDTATSTANYTANSGTVAVGSGASGISIVSGSGSSITIQADASSAWQTSTGTLTIGTTAASSNLILKASGSNSNVQVNGSSQVLFGQNAGDPATCNVGAIIYNTSTHTLRGCQGTTPTWNDIINVTAFTLQQNYTASTGGSTPEIKLDTTRGALDIQGDNAGAVTDLFNVHAGTASGLGQSLFDVAYNAATPSTTTTLSNTVGDSLLVADGVGSGGTNDISIGSGNSAHGTDPTILVLDNYMPITGTSGIPTEQDGAMYYNADQNLFECGYDSFWSPCGINSIQSSYNFEDEFLSGTAGSGQLVGVGNLGWYVTPAGSGTCTEAYNTNTSGVGPGVHHDHPGVLRFVTSATTSEACVMTQGGTGAGSPSLNEVIGAGDSFKAAFAVGSTTGTARIGWTNQTAFAAPVSGAWWQLTGGNLQYCYGNGTSSTCATAQAVAVNTWAEVEIYVNSTSNITFVSNVGGNTTSNTTTNTFDPGTTNALSPGTSCNTGGATVQTEYVDYIQWAGFDTSGDGVRD